MNADWNKLRQLTARGGSFPAWSPDGRKVALVSLRGRTSQIYAMNAVGSVAAIPHASFDPSWVDKIAARASYSAWVDLEDERTLDLAVWPSQSAARDWRAHLTVVSSALVGSLYQARVTFSLLLDPIAHAGPSGLRSESAIWRGGHHNRQLAP